MRDQDTAFRPTDGASADALPSSRAAADERPPDRDVWRWISATASAAWREAALTVDDFGAKDQLRRLRRAPVRVRAFARWVRRFARVALAPIAIAWDAVVHFAWDDSTTQAGAIAFAGLLAFFPFVIFVLALAGLIGQTEQAADAVAIGVDLFPEQVAAVVQSVLDQIVSGAGGQLLTISVAAALWAASSGVESLRHALNRAYDVEDPPAFWMRRLHSIGVTIVAAFTAMLAIVFVVIGSFLESFVTWIWDESTAHQTVGVAWSSTIGFLLLCVTITGLYVALPNRKITLREAAPGVALVIIAWYAAAKGFSYYVAEFGRYNVTYGSLGGVVMALLFFYISAAIFIFGAQINAATWRWRERMRQRVELETARARQSAPPDAADWV